MSSQAVKPVRNVAIFPNTTPPSVEPVVTETSWIKRRLYDLGVLSMANEPARPPGFFVNITTLSVWIAIIASILGGFWFMHTRIDDAGYQRGILEEQQKQQNVKMSDMQRQIDKAADDARRAAMLGASQSGHDEQKKK